MLVIAATFSFPAVIVTVTVGVTITGIAVLVIAATFSFPAVIIMVTAYVPGIVFRATVVTPTVAVMLIFFSIVSKIKCAQVEAIRIAPWARVGPWNGAQVIT